MLNVKNRNTLADRFGRETDGWIGKKVTLITRSVQGPNGPCQGIRFADAPVGELIEDELPPSMTDKPKKKRAFTVRRRPGRPQRAARPLTVMDDAQRTRSPSPR